MKVPKEYKYFTMLADDWDGQKDKYSVVNNRSHIELGTIFWYPQWRQFVFSPDTSMETIWSEGCLRDIQDFLKELREGKE